MSMLAPESTTKSLSSGFIVDAAGKTHSSEGEKNVAFFRVCEIKDVPGKFPRVSAGASLLSCGLFLRSRWWELLTWFFPSDGPLLSRMFAWRSAALVNRTRRIGPETFVPFREIFTDSGGSASCETQPNCRTLFTIATALLSPPFFGLLFGCSSTFQCGNEHSSPNLHPVSHL